MLVHECEGCAKVSLNRIAANDLPDVILEVYRTSLETEIGIRSRLECAGVRVLGDAEYELVTRQLLGSSAHARLGTAG